MVEEARLESVYTPKGYRGFESPFLRSIPPENRWDFLYTHLTGLIRPNPAFFHLCVRTGVATLSGTLTNSMDFLPSGHQYDRYPFLLSMR